MSTPTELARRFTLDWIDRADADVPREIMAADYRVHIGDTELDGLEPYLTGTLGQLGQFPGLLLTVHELITDGERLAFSFTEHGPSARHDGRVAAWRGVALFRTGGGRLLRNWTQEDYYARRRQLAGSAPDAIDPPAAAPWATPSEAAETGALDTARAWLAAPVFEAVRLDDGTAPVVEPRNVEVVELFGAGPDVAFAATWRGAFRGPLDGVTATDADVELGATGILHVQDGRVAGGTVVTDRLGLRRRLLGR